MNNRLIIATLAGVGFLAALGIAIVRGDLSQQPPAQGRLPQAAVPLQTVAVRPITRATALEAAPLEPAAPLPAAGGPTRDGGGTDLGPAPTYEQEAAARDRAAAHSARSR
jgi:hypothetical protein